MLWPDSETGRRNAAQVHCIRALASALPGFTETDWAASGYRREFDRIWASAGEALKRDPESVLLCVLATTSRVGEVLDGKYVGPVDSPRRPGKLRRT